MGKHILIVEDEKEIALLYEKILQAKGYVTEVAFDGLEGLKKLKGFFPDLILLDINMSHMGGLEFYQHICDSNRRPKYPVLVLTARTNLEDMFKDLPIDGFVNKPFDGTRLLNEIENFFKKQSWEKKVGKSDRIIVERDGPPQSVL